MEASMSDELVFRPAFTVPGQQLIGDGRRYEAFGFARETGIWDLYDFEEISYPIPVYRELPVGARRFAGIPAKWMWHPLFWLPTSIAGQIHIDQLSEDQLCEVHAVRVVLHLDDTGVYDSENGVFLDVMHLYGLDIENQADLARITAWQNGGADEVLDNIDLSELFDLDADGKTVYQAFSDAVDILYAPDSQAKN
jgi:hypothetical protein